MLILLAIHSCDTFKGDEIEPEKQVTFSQTEYYVLPGSSVVIDLESIVKQSFTDATLNISQTPIAWRTITPRCAPAKVYCRL